MYCACRYVPPDLTGPWYDYINTSPWPCPLKYHYVYVRGIKCPAIEHLTYMILQTCTEEWVILQWESDKIHVKNPLFE